MKASADLVSGGGPFLVLAVSSHGKDEGALCHLSHKDANVIPDGSTLMTPSPRRGPTSQYQHTGDSFQLRNFEGLPTPWLKFSTVGRSASYAILRSPPSRDSDLHLRLKARPTFCSALSLSPSPALRIPTDVSTSNLPI